MSFVRRGVVVSGDNPGMTLYDGERRTAVASFWNVEHAAAGRGQALLAWTPERGPRYLTDAPDAAAFVLERLTRHFPEFAGIDLGGVVAEPATFELAMELPTGLQVMARGAGTLEATWSRPLDARLVHWRGFELGDGSLDLTLTLLPCRSASLAVDGQLAAGQPRVDRSGEWPRSSAFIAVAETWTEPAAE